MKSGLLFALLLAASASRAPAQTGVGAKFGARDPRTCASLKEPVKGAPAAEQLKRYFICGEEKVTNSIASGDSLHLVTNVTLEVARGRPFNPATDSWHDIDVTQTVYPVRGGYTYFVCSTLARTAEIGGNPAKTCFKYEQPHAVGICYKNTFGDWRCKFSDADVTGTTMELFPPPAGK